ncbi:MAG: PAS domain S-box protein, partial [Luteolibacter sp.]
PMSENAKPDETRRPGYFNTRAWKVALAYAVFATLWICFSDHALGALLPDPELLVKWSLAKGLFFVAVTSILLLLLMRQVFGLVETGYASLKAKETERQAHENELVRMSRLYSALSQVNQAIVWSPDREALLTKVCQVLVEFGQFRMVWIGWHNPETKRLDRVASWGDAGNYLENIGIYSDERPEGCGPIGTAFREERSYICNDMLADASTLPWREEVVRCGFHSCAAFPIRLREKPCGTLTVYSNEKDFFQDKESELLVEAAMDISFALDNLVKADEHHRVEAALRVSEERYRTTIDTMMEGCHLIGFDWRYLYLNAVAAVHNRRPNEELLGRTMHDAWEGIEETDIFVPLKRCMEERTAQHCDVEFLFEEGGSGWFEVRCYPIPEGIFILSMDISERKQAEARIREQASFLDKAQDAIIVRDLDHRIFFWNRSAERLYGWTIEEAVGSSIKELLYEDSRDFLAATQKTLEHGEWVGEIEQLTKDGEMRTVEGHWSLVHDDLGKPKAILAINTDITERKHLEQQFLRAQRMESIGTLAGGIAHDLNNVLAPIMMSIDLLRSYVNNPNGLEILSLVGESARRGAEMVSQVLTFARGVEGRSVDVQVAHVVRDLVRIIGETFPKNIQLETLVESGLWSVKGDPTQIHQVLLNLCVNSRDAMPEGGRITIRAENLVIDEHYAGMNIEASPGPYLKIEVEDTGHGISAGIMDKLFDPFFTTKEVGKGTGLGLSTSLAIIRSHGGFIRAYSDPGTGARFRIYLPGETDAGHDGALLSETNLPRGRGETVLVVDDEASIRQITKQTLEAFGYKVLLAADGSEAVSVYVTHQDRIAVVLTDMMMPVMDGPATIQVLRRRNPSLKIIGASGISANGKVAKAASAGLNHFLPKPYTAETLLKAIQDILAEDD